MENDVREALDRLERKLDIKNDRVQDKMDTINASITELLGPLATVTQKVESQGKLIWWLFGIISAVIVSVIVGIINVKGVTT